MKKSIKNRYQVMLLSFFILFMLESILIFVSPVRSSDVNQLRSDIYSIVIMFIFIQFIFFLVMFYYIPYKYNQAHKKLFLLIQEISEGKYEFDLEIKTHQQFEEIKEIMIAMQRMMNVISRFDDLKTEKIYEHHQRLQLLLNMIPQGCLIMSIIGEVVYVNDFVKKEFPSLAENVNIIETLLPREAEDTIKAIIMDSIKTGNNLHGRTFTVETTRKHYKISSNLVRNRKGQSIGAIFILVKA